jgi:hypothetical protein
MAVGVISLVGYLVGQPLLYYYVENLNTGMAMHTSVLFALMGFALSILKAPEEIIYSPVRIQTKLVSLFLASSMIPIIFVLGLNYTITQNLEPLHTTA